MSAINPVGEPIVSFDEQYAFLQAQGGLFSKLLQDVVSTTPSKPSLYILQRLLDESTNVELDQAGVVRHKDRGIPSDELLSRTILQDLFSRCMKRHLALRRAAKQAQAIRMKQAALAQTQAEA